MDSVSSRGQQVVGSSPILSGEGGMAGKVVLFTGGTDGLGAAAARALAGQGARLRLVARSAEKGAAAVAAIEAASPGADVRLIRGDLASLADVRAVAAAFREENDRLDLLVNNAGAIFTTRQLSADGFELTFAVNHLAHFLLTNLMLDLLRATPGARVVSTASDAQLSSKLDLDRVATAETGYTAFGAYADSKLCNVLFTRELARRVGPAVSVSCFHPGFVGTNIGANNGGFMVRIWTTVGRLIARSPERGADTLLWLATRASPPEPDGGYYADRKPGKRSALALDDALASALWALSERCCGLTP